MKSLHKSNEILPDMSSTSLTSGTYQTVSIMTLGRPSSDATIDVLYINHSVAIAGLSKLKPQSTNPDNAEFAIVFHV